MKRLLSNAACRWMKVIGCSFIIFHLSFGEAQSQVRFGLKGGFQLASMQFNSETLDNSNRAGFFVGPSLQISLPLTGLSVDASLLYDHRDLKVQHETFRQQSLVFAGDMRAGVGLGGLLGIFLLGGPQFSFNVGDDVSHWLASDGELRQFSLQETMLSFNLGAGVSFARHFECSLRYNIPVSKTADFTWGEFSDVLFQQTWHHAKTRTNAWSIAASYYF